MAVYHSPAPLRLTRGGRSPGAQGCGKLPNHPKGALNAPGAMLLPLPRPTPELGSFVAVWPRKPPFRGCHCFVRCDSGGDSVHTVSAAYIILSITPCFFSLFRLLQCLLSAVVQWPVNAPFFPPSPCICSSFSGFVVSQWGGGVFVTLPRNVFCH